MRDEVLRVACSEALKRASAFAALLFHCMRCYRIACASLVCHSFWQLSFFQSPVLGSLAMAPLDDFRPAIFILVASSAVYVGGWRRSGLFARWAQGPWYPRIAGACMIGGTVCRGFAPFVLDAAGAAVLVAIASVAMGMGAACYVIGMGRVFAQWGPRVVLGMVSVAQLLAVVVLSAAALLPMEAQAVLLAAAALGAWTFFLCCEQQFPKSRLFDCDRADPLPTPKRLVATCFAQGVALGAMSALGGFSVQQGEALAATAAAFAFGTILVALTAGIMKLDFNHLLYQVTFPLMGMGFLVSIYAPGNTSAATFVFMVAHCYAYVVVVCINAYFGYCLKCSPTWIVSLTTCSMVVGQIIALGVGNVFAAYDCWSSAIAPFSATMAFLVPTVALLLFSRRNPVSGWGAISPVQQKDRGEDALFAKIASDCGLTARETEITAYLARGRNKRVISQELGLAEETVKTHMGNVYRKLQVHSQQELIDLVEAERGARDR